MSQLSDLVKNASILGLDARETVYVSQYLVGAKDHEALNAAAAATPTGGRLDLTTKDLYVIDQVVDWNTVGDFVANNVTIKPTKALIESGVNSVMHWNKSKQTSTPATPVPVTKGSTTINLPAGFACNAGDMIYFRGNRDPAGEKWLADPTGGTGHYYHGMYATVQSLTGTQAAGYTAKLSKAFYANFSVVTFERHVGMGQMRVANLTVDMSNTAETSTKYIEAMSVYGANIFVSGVRFVGNEYGIVGLGLYGQNALVLNSTFEKFLCIQGQANAQGDITGRTGYGVVVNCNNATFINPTTSDCKHHIASGGHYAVGSNLKIINMMASEDPTLPYTVTPPASGGTPGLYEGVIDVHCGMTGRLEVVGGEFSVYSKVCLPRHKTAWIYKCQITTWNTGIGSIVSGYEQGMDGILVQDCDITFAAGSQMGIFSVRGLVGTPGTAGGNDYVRSYKGMRIQGCRVYGTNGSGYLLDITNRTSFTVDGFDAIDVECFGMKAAINVNTQSAVQAELYMRNITLSNVRMDGCEQLVNFYAETPAANPATDLYYLRNWDLSGATFVNPISATLSPVSLTSPVDSRNVEIKNFKAPGLIDLTSAVTASGTAYCMILQVSMTNAKLPGTYIRGAGAQQARGISLGKANYTDLDLAGLVSDSNIAVTSPGALPTTFTRMKAAGATLRDLRFEETAQDIRFTNPDLSGITANLIRFACRSGSTAWANSTEVVLSNNTLTTTNGYALEIDANSTGHKIVRRNNRATSRNQVDLSGTYYGRPLGNTNPIRTYSVGTWGKGATTTFNLPNLNVGSGPFLTVGQLITIAGVTGTGAAAVNGKTVPVIAISGSTVTVPINTSAEAGTLNSSGNITTTSSIDWKGGTQADPDGRLLSAGVPTSGTWGYLDKVEFADPFTAGWLGAVCQVPGTPGTWRRHSALEA